MFVQHSNRIEQRIPRKGWVVIAFVLMAVSLGCTVQDLVMALFAVSPSTEVISGSDRYAAVPQSRTSDGAFVLGSPDTLLTIVEFADALCPHCQAYKPTIDQFIEMYVMTGQARYEYRFFPTVDREATTPRLLECVDTLKPGAFWTGVDVFYELVTQSQFNPDRTPSIFAERMGLSATKLTACTEKAQQVNVDQAFGRQLGVQGTPAVMVRYGDKAPIWITLDGETYDRGGVPFEVLAKVVESPIAPNST